MKMRICLKIMHLCINYRIPPQKWLNGNVWHKKSTNFFLVLSKFLSLFKWMNLNILTIPLHADNATLDVWSSRTWPWKWHRRLWCWYFVRERVSRRCRSTTIKGPIKSTDGLKWKKCHSNESNLHIHTMPFKWNTVFIQIKCSTIRLRFVSKT